MEGFAIGSRQALRRERVDIVAVSGGTNHETSRRLAIGWRKDPLVVLQEKKLEEKV